MIKAKFIYRFRKRVGMTQEMLAEKLNVSTTSVQYWEKGLTGIRQEKLKKLAEIFNVPLSELIAAQTAEAVSSEKNNWPDFLFEHNPVLTDVIDELHLNLTQQDLFGNLYIYGARILKEGEVYTEIVNPDYIDLTQEEIEHKVMSEDLKLIPFEFVNRVKSIQFLNHADALLKVVRYIKTDFLLKVLKMNPENEFNVKKLSKELICEFIDGGFRDYVSFRNPDLQSGILMRKAKEVLAFLEAENEIKLTDGIDNTMIRHDLPEDIIKLLTSDSGFDWSERLERGFSRHVDIALNGIRPLTDYDRNTGILSMNEKGRLLLQWFRE